MFSEYLSEKLLRHVFLEEAYIPPADVYLGLRTSAGEVTGGSYARKVVSAVWSGTAITTDAAVSFPGMPACVVTEGWLYDAATGGNALVGGALAASITVTAGNTLVLPAGDVVIDLV